MIDADDPDDLCGGEIGLAQPDPCHEGPGDAQKRHKPRPGRYEADELDDSVACGLDDRARLGSCGCARGCLLRRCVSFADSVSAGGLAVLRLTVRLARRVGPSSLRHDARLSTEIRAVESGNGWSA